MLKLPNTKHKLGMTICSIGIISLSFWSFLNLSYTPKYAHAAEDTKTIDNIKYMQEMSPHVCESMKESTTTVDNQKRLVDHHDDKSYWVAKFKDGRCWMTQNLDLNVPEAGLLPQDTNITEPWNSESDYPPRPTTTSSDIKPTFGSTTTEISVSYDPGETYCGNSKCTATQSQNDKHDAIGNYYNFTAATAGTGTVLLGPGGNASGDICPKGWKLPTQTGNQNGIFDYLITLTEGINVAQPPYYFTFAGGYFSTGLMYVGNTGNYMSSTSAASQSYDVHGVNIYTNELGIHRSGGGDTGKSVRCVNSETFYNWQAPEEDDTNINVTIPTILTVEASSNVDPNITPNNITNGTITATVSSNTEYNIFLSADQPNLINNKDPEGTNIPANTNVSPNNNAWAIKNDSTGNTYKAIKTTTDTFYNTKTTNTLGNDIYTYNLGISIAPSLPAGTYSTAVTVTASTK